MFPGIFKRNIFSHFLFASLGLIKIGFTITEKNLLLKGQIIFLRVDPLEKTEDLNIKKEKETNLSTRSFS